MPYKQRYGESSEMIHTAYMVTYTGDVIYDTVSPGRCWDPHR